MHQPFGAYLQHYFLLGTRIICASQPACDLSKQIIVIPTLRATDRNQLIYEDIGLNYALECLLPGAHAGYGADVFQNVLSLKLIELDLAHLSQYSSNYIDVKWIRAYTAGLQYVQVPAKFITIFLIGYYRIHVGDDKPQHLVNNNDVWQVFYLDLRVFFGSCAPFFALLLLVFDTLVYSTRWLRYSAYHAK